MYHASERAPREYDTVFRQWPSSTSTSGHPDKMLTAPLILELSCVTYTKVCGINVWGVFPSSEFLEFYR